MSDNSKCEHCGQDEGNASPLCGGIFTHNHSFPATSSDAEQRPDQKQMNDFFADYHRWSQDQREPESATSSDELVKEIDDYFDSRSEHAGFDPWEMVALLRKCKAALEQAQ